MGDGLSLGTYILVDKSLFDKSTPHVGCGWLSHY